MIEILKSAGGMISGFAIGFLFLFIFRKTASRIGSSNFIVLYLAISLTLIAPFIAYYAIAIAKNILAKELPVYGSVSDWIGFLGSVFGGFITMFGIWVTIIETKKQSKNEIALQSIPLIKLEFGCDMKSFESSLVVGSEYDNQKFIKDMSSSFPFQIMNSSNYIARDIKVIDFKLYDAPDVHIEFETGYGNLVADLTDRVQVQTHRISTIPGGYQESFFVSFPNILHKSRSLLFEGTVQYYDYLHEIKHTIVAQLLVHVHVAKSEEIEKNTVTYVYTIDRAEVVNRFIK